MGPRGSGALPGSGTVATQQPQQTVSSHEMAEVLERMKTLEKQSKGKSAGNLLENEFVGSVRSQFEADLEPERSKSERSHECWAHHDHSHDSLADSRRRLASIRGAQRSSSDSVDRASPPNSY